MEYRRFLEKRISALVLGTVQFGLDYGVANTTGKPDQSTVNTMMAAAFDAGVNAIDTASMYNDAEMVVGQALADLGVSEKTFICSKARPMENSSGSPEDQIEAAVERSLRRLRVDQIGLYLLHSYEALPYVDALHRKREAGDIGAVGVSVYSVEQALSAIATPGIDAVQHPTSMLDQRFVRGGVVERAAKEGVAIFARSIFLQGLVTMDPLSLPKRIGQIRKVLVNLGRLAGDLSIEGLALRFVLSLPNITGVVVGMETVNQMERNLAAIEKGHLDSDLLEMIHQTVPNLSEEILDPSRWAWARDHDWGRPAV